MALGPDARFDVYEVIGPLDAGCMGEVWLARVTDLGQKVANRLLPGDLSREQTRVPALSEARPPSSPNHSSSCISHAGATPERTTVTIANIDGT